MSKISTLNIDTFNGILLEAAKDEESKIKILEAELEIVASLYMAEVAKLLDELENNGYKSEQFQKIINLKNNTESLFVMHDELKSKVKKGAECERTRED